MEAANTIDTKVILSVFSYVVLLALIHPEACHTENYDPSGDNCYYCKLPQRNLNLGRITVAHVCIAYAQRSRQNQQESLSSQNQQDKLRSL